MANNRSNLILCLPNEIKEMIFQHLDEKSLLAASEASSVINDFVADSRRCMKRITVKMTRKTITDDDVRSIIESSRRYENIEVSYFFKLIEPATEVMSTRIWKNVELRSLNFKSMAVAVEFLRLFESTVEDLIIHDVSCRLPHNHEAVPNLNFPKLKILEAKIGQALLFKKAFFNCKKLETLSIKPGSDVSLNTLTTIKNILKSNAGLKKLEIGVNVFNSLIDNDDDISDFPFELTEYAANDLFVISNVYSFWHVFLQSQGKSIERLYLSDWMGDEALQIVFKMPRLKKLSLKGFHHMTMDNDVLIFLQQNLEIVELEIDDWTNNQRILEKFIEAAPRLKSLRVYTMRRKSMKILTKIESS